MQTVRPRKTANEFPQHFAIISEVTAPIVAGSLGSTAQLLDGTASAHRDVSVEFLPPVAGTVWQIDNQTLDPRGNWQRLGATELWVQWSAGR